jgi:hypothetical protein
MLVCISRLNSIRNYQKKWWASGFRTYFERAGRMTPLRPKRAQTPGQATGAFLIVTYAARRFRVLAAFLAARDREACER